MVETGPITAEAEGPTGRTTRTFEDFFDAEHVRLYRALTVVTGDRQEAEDVMQDAFIRLWERWDRVGSMDDPVGYLYRTAMNLVRMHARRARVRARRLLGGRPGGEPFGQVDERDRLDRALERLTRRQRSALVLIDLYQFTSEEAARILRTAPVTARRLAGIARRKLREVLEEQDG